MATIIQVAQEAGVSPTTVSRSFTDSPLLSRETRERVMEVADRLNYRPPHIRKKHREAALAGQSALSGGAIGFQFFAPDDSATIQSDAFYAPLMAGAQAEAEKLELHLLLHTTTRHRMLSELPRMIREQAVSGMLLVGTADPEILTAFLEHVPQIVLVDNRDGTGRHDCIVSDGIAGAALSTKYLFDLGHRRIGFAMSESQTPTFQDRLTGYLAAHFRAGLPADSSLIVATGTEEDFNSQVRALLARPDRPTAFVAANDPHAYRLIQMCRESGLQIPGDIGVIGFDDDNFSALCYPPLTTLRVDTAYMGRLAIQRLQARILESRGAGEPEPPITLQVPVSLVVRDSCRPLNQS